MEGALLQVNVNKGCTLIVEGPARAKIKSGEVEIFGATFKENSEIEIDPYKALPLYCLRRSRLEISNGKISLIAKDTIPEDWRNLVDKISLNKGKYTKIIVLGGLDVGKTGLVTFLANKFFLKNLKVGVIDADVGQSDIGPPTTIGLGVIEKPIASLNQARLVDAVFIGSTSPSGLLHRVFAAILQLLNIAISSERCDLILIDTTGWISGRGRDFKIFKIATIQPDYIIGIQKRDELEPILKWAEKTYRVYRVKAAEHTKPRSREERRYIREYIYRKWFSGASIKELDFNKVTIIGTIMFTGNMISSSILEHLSRMLDVTVLYGEKVSDSLFIVVNEDKAINESVKGKLAKLFNVRQVQVQSKSFFKNLLVAFQSKSKLLNDLGIIVDVDFKKQKFKVLTKADLNDNVIMFFGQLKINANTLKEEEWIRFQPT